MKNQVMRNLLISLFLINNLSLVSQSAKLPDTLVPFVDFLKSEELLSPKDYIINAFNENDIVILSERHHGELKQYKLIVEVIKDSKFRGNIYTEVGTVNNTKKVNEFLLKEGLSKEEKEIELNEIYRNWDYEILWDNYNYYFLISSIFDINQGKNSKEKIKLFPLDVSFSWDAIKCSEQLKMFFELMQFNTINRNYVMGENFVSAFESIKKISPDNRKALVILNTYHGYTRIPKHLTLPSKPYIYSTAQYIFKTYPYITTNILINGYIFHPEPALVADGIWDAAFKINGNKNIAFTFKGTPFGSTQFDMYLFGRGYDKTSKFEDIFDGFIFCYPVEDFEIATGIPNIFTDDYSEMYYQRSAMEYGITIEEAKRSKEINESLDEVNKLKIKKVDGLEKLNEDLNKWLIE